MLSNRVSGGRLTREEARQRQLLKYEQDMKTFAEKQKEKENKKKAEKWKKYSHISVGERLSPSLSTSVNVVREQQQNRYDLEGIYGYIAELERENARLKREEEKHREKLNKLAHPDLNKKLDSANHQEGGSCFSSNEVLNQRCEGASEIHKPSGSTSNNESQSTTTTLPGADEDKEEKFKREMREVRDKMQMMYNKHVQDAKN